jgi:hypothetical protein
MVVQAASIATGTSKSNLSQRIFAANYRHRRDIQAELTLFAGGGG